MKIIGFILIGFGIVALVYKGITFSHNERDAKIGPITISHEEKNTLPLSPIVGVIAIAAGMGMVATRKSA